MVFLAGQVLQDPLVRIDRPGKLLVTFRLLVKEERRDADVRRSFESVHTVQCWGALADMVRDRVRKGSELLITGELTNREMESGRQETEIRMKEVMWGAGEQDENSSSVDSTD